MGGETDIKECPLVANTILSQIKRVEAVCTRLEATTNTLTTEVALLKQKDALDDKKDGDKETQGKHASNLWTAVVIGVFSGVMGLLGGLAGFFFDK